MNPGETYIPTSFYLALGVPVAATLAFFLLRFLTPRAFVPHPDELDDEEEDQSPPSSLSASSSAPAGGSDTTAPGTGESAPKG
jgi:hypothetical protein